MQSPSCSDPALVPDGEQEGHSASSPPSRVMSLIPGARVAQRSSVSFAALLPSDSTARTGVSVERAPIAVALTHRCNHLAIANDAHRMRLIRGSNDPSDSTTSASRTPGTAARAASGADCVASEEAVE